MAALTRRAILQSGAAIGAAAGTSIGIAAAVRAMQPDPLLALIARWQAAHDAWIAAEDEIDRLAGQIDQPIPKVRIGWIRSGLPEPVPIYAWTEDQIANQLGPDIFTSHIKAEQLAEFRAQQERITTAEAALGMPELRTRISALDQEASDLVDQILDCPATTPAGAAAKLRLLVKVFLRDKVDDVDGEAMETIAADLDRMGAA